MKRYYQFVKEVEKGEIDIAEFVFRLFGNSPGWHELFAAYRIYVEDGGKRFGAEDFLKIPHEGIDDEKSLFDLFMSQPVI